MKLRLFHKIGEQGEDSAGVRRFVVENRLEDLIEFSNVTYDGARQAMHELAGPDAAAPVLLVDGKALHGKPAIIDWLKTNVLCLRD